MWRRFRTVPLVLAALFSSAGASGNAARAVDSDVTTIRQDVEDGETGPPSLLPNVLWISSEDNGPHLGAYGDRDAVTPNLDRLAARGLRFVNAWANAPVCAPARTAIITGVLPTSTGSEHMRSMARMPPFMRMFPELLRERGYYTTNNVKEDYNLERSGAVWDDSSDTGHWRHRRPGQPFFAVFNITLTHESQIRSRPHTPQHDPSAVRIPAYHPDTPEVRQDWAQYHDKMTEMDTRVGELLGELEDAGLAEDTIVFYWGDHGPGMPRDKRWLYHSGLHVPLIVHVPERFRALAPEEYAAGAESDRLVSLMDLAPTMLSLAGIEPPEWMHGHAFMGRFETPGPTSLAAFRGRMDERVDLSRAVRDSRYLYIRNYLPHRPQGQYLSYMFQTPTTRVWKRLYDEEALEPPQTSFWEPKPSEELYDLARDPDTVRNLAASPEHRAARRRLRARLREHLLATRDLGFLPEADMHRRAAGRTPWEMGQDEAAYPLERILDMAERASSPRDGDLDELLQGLEDEDPAVRYWAATGVLIRGDAAARRARPQLEARLDDAAAASRIGAAEALARLDDPTVTRRALDTLVALSDVSQQDYYVVVLALNALVNLGDRVEPVEDAILALPREAGRVHQREQDYLPRLLEAIAERHR